MGMRRVGRAVWDLAVAPGTFVGLSVLWCLDLAVGSILAYRADPRFWMKMDAVPFNVWLRDAAPAQWPGSWWVYGLVGLTYLVVASLLLCTLNWFWRRRRGWRGAAEVLVHLGFLLIFAGFVLGSGFGARAQGLRVAVGGEAEVPDTGYRLRVEAVNPVAGPDGRPWDVQTRVSLWQDGQKVAEGDVRTNRPLIAGTTVVYPQGVQTVVRSARIATTRGSVEVDVGAEAEVAQGLRVAVLGALSPGQRWGPYFGPGVLVEVRGGQEGGSRVFLAPGMGPVRAGGLGLRLVDLDLEPNGVYNVHQDPGVWFVMVGAALLTLGTLWAAAVYFARL
ncbi:MAG: cytochrome c biogenesis protein ResB [Deltaproteobacteria bacterium]|nr:cytochrome c biogenesis protein ResB [Deltaproteobacteria bacterium]